MIRQSDLLRANGFAHGFATRVGGVSAPPFDTLNLGRTLGDDPASVEENHRRLAAEVGYDVARLFECSQVHGASVRSIGEDDLVSGVRAVEADALVVTRPGDAIGVRTADCVPILVADPVSGAVAAIHAGWRGFVAGVIGAGVGALCERSGATHERLLCAIGPHIRLDSFEVGHEVAHAVAAASLGAEVVLPREPRPHVDLATGVRAQLAELGLERDRIDDVGGDTFADEVTFYSHRRDGARSGRHLSVIVAR